MAYTNIVAGSKEIKYIGTGVKPTLADAGARLYDTNDYSHWIFDGSTWKAYKAPILTT